MLETSARLLRLLSLLQTHRDWSGTELADRLDVTTRTVRRDVDKLRGLGYPVHAVSGTAGGYRLGAGAALPPLLLDDDEAVAVAVGLRTAAGGSVAGIEETSVRALAKLEQVLPSRLRHRVALLSQVTVPIAAHGPTVDSDVLTAVATACRDHQRLRFDYRDHDGTESLRTTEPHRLVHTGRRWYLVAWDVDRADWRTYRADRIRPRIPTGPRFEPRDPPADDLGSYTQWGITNRAYRYQARLLMHAPAEAVSDKIGPAAGVIEPVDDATCVLHAGGPTLDALAVYLSFVDTEFEVLDPPELNDRVRALGDRLIRAANRQPRPGP